MNFRNMPELDWQHGYLYSTIITVLSTLATVWYFRVKKWL
jgi:magnesium transporter